MNIKQVIVALVLLAAGIAVFGFLASRTAPVATTPQTQMVAASQSLEEGPYLRMVVDYPEATSPERAVIETDMRALAAQFKANAQIDSLTPEDVAIQGLGGDRKYTLEAEYKKFEAPAHTSYVYLIYEDTLGAHPNVYFKTFVFDRAGNKVALSSLFPNNPNWLEELSLLVSTDVSAQYRERAQVDDLTNLIYPEGVSPNEANFSNFVVDGDTLVIFIPPYQVAAYAVGAFEVRIPLASLQ